MGSGTDSAVWDLTDFTVTRQRICAVLLRKSDEFLVSSVIAVFEIFQCFDMENPIMIDVERVHYNQLTTAVIKAESQ